MAELDSARAGALVGVHKSARVTQLWALKLIFKAGDL